MENTRITLPESKYVVELKPYITNGMFRKYQKSLMKTATVKLNDPNNAVVDISSLMDAQDAMLPDVLIAIYNEKGEVLPDPIGVVSNLSVLDGRQIYEYMEGLLNASGADQKKIG